MVGHSHFFRKMLEVDFKFSNASVWRYIVLYCLCEHSRIYFQNEDNKILAFLANSHDVYYESM